LSGWHGRAVHARPARGCLGTSSPRYTSELTPNTSTGASSSSSRSMRYSSRGARRRQILGGRTNPISLGRERPAKPLGGAGRGSSGEWFAQGGAGDGRRNRPEWPGDGSGDPIARGREKRRRWACEGSGWVGWPRPEPGWLSLAKWAGWASRPNGPAGQLGQRGCWQNNLNKNFKFKSYLISWIQIKIQKSKQH
jgi:hypothetical protein